MKKHHILYFMASLAFFNSCQKNCADDVVCETYVHRYGVPLQASDWSERGAYGQVISTKKDGVVICKTYEAGVLNGEVTYTFPHRDTIAKRCNYANGQLLQEIHYYSNGMPQKQINFEGFTQNVVGWYESGAPQFKESYYDNSLIHGEYFDPSQQRESCVLDQNGTRTFRDEHGQLLSIDEIENGQMCLRKTYYANGSPQSITPYVNGNIEGKRWTYHMGGEPATLEEWANNFQHGNTEVFENGEKIADQPYVYGNLHGVERCYRNGCTLIQENQWVQGEKHGPCHNYFDEEKRTEWYFKNLPVNRGAFQAMSNR